MENSIAVAEKLYEVSAMGPPQQGNRLVYQGSLRDLTMTELWKYTFETIWDGGGIILSQAMPPEQTSPILVASPAYAQATAVSVAQLKHAYALRKELDIAWAARPFELVHHQGKPALLMQHPGGELLAAMHREESLNGMGAGSILMIAKGQTNLFRQHSTK